MGDASTDRSAEGPSPGPDPPPPAVAETSIVVDGDLSAAPADAGAAPPSANAPANDPGSSSADLPAGGVACAPHDLSPGTVPAPTSVADGVPRSLDPRHVAAESISWWIFTALVFLAGAIALPIVWRLGSPDPWIILTLLAAWLAAIALLVWGALAWPRVAYRHASYRVSPWGLEIRRGVIWRQVIDVPKSRVQHTDVIQGPIMRRFGLALLIVHTAGTQHATVALQGLARETALALRDFLIRGGADDGV